MRISDWSSDVCSSDLRQKVAIGRALLKHPCLLILHDATASLDSASRAMLFDTVLEHTEGRGLVWVADQVPKPERFDRIVLFQGGAPSGRAATTRSATGPTAPWGQRSDAVEVGRAAGRAGVGWAV